MTNGYSVFSTNKGLSFAASAAYLWESLLWAAVSLTGSSVLSHIASHPLGQNLSLRQTTEWLLSNWLPWWQNPPRDQVLADLGEWQYQQLPSSGEAVWDGRIQGYYGVRPKWVRFFTEPPVNWMASDCLWAWISLSVKWRDNKTYFVNCCNDSR